MVGRKRKSYAVALTGVDGGVRGKIEAIKVVLRLTDLRVREAS
jgi:hypothetical protein